MGLCAICVTCRPRTGSKRRVSKRPEWPDAQCDRVRELCASFSECCVCGRARRLNGVKSREPSPGPASCSACPRALPSWKRSSAAGRQLRTSQRRRRDFQAVFFQSCSCWRRQGRRARQRTPQEPQRRACITDFDHGPTQWTELFRIGSTHPRWPPREMRGAPSRRHAALAPLP